MRKILYCFCITLFMGCSTSSKNPTTVITNLYESSSTDSINQVLRTQDIAIRIVSTEDAEIDTLFVDRYVVIEERIGYCIWAITDMPDYYWMDFSENLVGYSIGFIYNKANSALFQTEEFDLDGTGMYNILYETCDFDACAIDVKYEDESVEKIHFSKCTSDTIRL